MAVTGHKTRAVFDCDHIVSPDALQDAARKRETATASGTVTRTGGNEDAEGPETCSPTPRRHSAFRMVDDAGLEPATPGM